MMLPFEDFQENLSRIDNIVKGWDSALALFKRGFNNLGMNQIRKVKTTFDIPDREYSEAIDQMITEIPNSRYLDARAMLSTERDSHR